MEADLLTKAIHSAKDEAAKLAEPLGRHVASAVAVSKSPFDAIAGPLGFGNPFAGIAGFDRMLMKSVTNDDLLIPTISISIFTTVNVLFKMERQPRWGFWDHFCRLLPSSSMHARQSE